MNWVLVESSVFTSAAYLGSKELLYLRFQSGEVYRYFEFPVARYEEFLAAESKGGYFAYHIRDRFRCERVRVASSHGELTSSSGK